MAIDFDWYKTQLVERIKEKYEGDNRIRRMLITLLNKQGRANSLKRKEYKHPDTWCQEQESASEPLN